MNKKLIGIILLVVTLIVTLVGVLFYDSQINTNIDLATTQNIDSIYNNANRSAIKNDETPTIKEKDVFITQYELDSIVASETKKTETIKRDQSELNASISNLRNSSHQLSNLKGNDYDIEDDSLFKAVAQKIKNRDTDNTFATSAPPQPNPSEIEKRRQILSTSWKQPSKENNNNLIQAVIHQTQTIKNNQTVSIRTKSSFEYKNTLIPKNTIIVGVANFNNNRLNIRVHNIRLNNQLIVANIAIYGSDGIEGLEVSRNEIKKSLDSDVTDEISSEVSSNLNKIGSQLGRVAGSLLGQTIRNVNNEKQQEVTLIDNQTIYLSLNYE